MSAAEYGLQEIANRGEVQCPNGIIASDITLGSFNSATAQVVSGAMVGLNVSANIEECGTNVPASFGMTLHIDFDGNFTLANYTYVITTSSGGSSHGETIVGPMLLILLMLACVTVLKPV